jgi:hypothetical protein
MLCASQICVHIQADCGYKLDISISKSGLHKRERCDLAMQVSVFLYKLEITIGLAAL